MKATRTIGVLATLVLAFTLRGGAQSPRSGESRPASAKTPIRLLGVIAIPGNPLVTSDIIWVDQATKRLYLADRSNFGIDIIDAENNLFVGRVPGFAGPEPSRGDPIANAGTPPLNGEGPSGVLVTPDKKVWAGDGNSIVKVADVDPASPGYLKVIQSISTAIPECGAHCNRADEIGYDPVDHIILIANDQPAPATPTTPPTRGNPYATFISADTHQVLGHIVFEGANGLEQPLWVPDQRRFFITVTGYRNNGGSNNGFGEVAVIDPRTMKVDKSFKPGACHPSAEALGASQHVLLSCGSPIVFDATDGKPISTITQIGAGDENWYNPGDGLFYFTGNDKSTPPTTTSSRWCGSPLRSSRIHRPTRPPARNSASRAPAASRSSRMLRAASRRSRRRRRSRLKGWSTPSPAPSAAKTSKSTSSPRSRAPSSRTARSAATRGSSPSTGKPASNPST